MSDKEFSLPKSSYKELTKILQGYAYFGEKPVQLSEITRLVGMNRTQISKNNGFLSDVGLITGGRAKQVSPLVIKLAKALEYAQSEDIQKHWTEVIQGTKFLATLITTVRIKGGMGLDELRKHIMYTAGVPENKDSSTGAGAIIDILLASNLLTESNGKIVVSKPESTPKDQVDIDTSVNMEQEGPLYTLQSAQISPSHGIPSIHINIELHLPATTESEIYDNLFLSLRKHLLTPHND